MKCWECKEKISEARIVHYYSPKQDKEASRDVCFKCLPFLKFNGCHYVEVEKITQGSLKTVRPMPTVTFRGETYKLKSRKTEIPNLESMSNFEALIWINKNTTAKGYRKEPNLVLAPGTII